MFYYRDRKWSWRKITSECVNELEEFHGANTVHRRVHFKMALGHKTMDNLCLFLTLSSSKSLSWITASPETYEEKMSLLKSP